MYLIRHGETKGNKERTIEGHTDSELTDAGVLQAESLGETLGVVVFDAVYSSDLSRAMRTAEPMLRGRGLVMYQTKNLRERNFGRFEGMSITEGVESLREAGVRHEGLSEEDSWRFKPEESIESNAELLSRFASELKAIAKTNPSKTVLISTHGGCIRMLLMKLKFAPYGSLPRGSFRNSGYVIIQCDGDDFAIQAVEGVTLDNDNKAWG